MDNCIHRRILDTATNIGTCSLCGDQKQYEPWTVNREQKTKTGRHPNKVGVSELSVKDSEKLVYLPDRGTIR